jgi:class 3 adenylate cyclase/FixJ family two-component response regulator
VFCFFALCERKKQNTDKAERYVMNERPTILIVDDEPFNIAVLEQELDDLGYDTISAADGQAALDQVLSEMPDLVLLDIRMPIMDGFTVLSRLKTSPATRDIPVIIISANNDMPSVVKGIKQGAEDYLPKPFDPVLLQARISACLDKKRLRDQELEYLRQVERLTQAAAAVEANTFDQEELAPVVARPDALGGLARVFQRMAREVHAREQRLKQQLQQLRLDLEERQTAAAETVAMYLPMDRRQALARGETLPEWTHGAALFADISGSTPLTETLAQELGLQRGAEEITRQINRVFGVLIDEVHRYGGSVINFSGDSITCWFDDGLEIGDRRLEIGNSAYIQSPISNLQSPSALRTVACALAMQAAMGQFAMIATPDGSTIALAIKIAVGAGLARRLLVGDPRIQNIEVLAGQVIDEITIGEHLAQRGEVLVQAAIVEADSLGMMTVADWRIDQASGKRFANVSSLTVNVPDSPWPDLPADQLSEDQIRPWLLPPVYERVHSGKSAFLSELRPVAALFLAFQGIDFNADEHAGATLDAFVRWVQAVLTQYDGALLQVTIGDKGNYLHAVFGAPIAHDDDAARAVAAALELQSPPADLQNVTGIGIGVAYGQMRAGAYGGITQRTYDVLGDKTNLAARLMQVATDGILCDEAIYHAARARLTFEALPPITVKGKARPVAIYRPLSKTPQSVMGSRIDQLAPAHQLTLKIASVIGRIFAVDLLRAILPVEADRTQLDADLEALEQLDLVIRQSGEFTQQSAYAFADALIQDIAYNRLLFAQRRQLHRAVAEWYERTCASDLAAHYPLMVQHWSKAEDVAKTMQYLEQAGEHARQCGDYQEALRYFNQSLALSAQSAVLSADYDAED